MKRTATAVWTDGGKNGRGTLSSQAGALKETAYSFSSRFENGAGTNPEELIGAAHAGCFSMALALALEAAGHRPERIETKADVSLEKEGAGWKIAKIQLTLRAQVPGVDAAEFKRIAEDAKANCPVSKVLKAEISLDIQEPRMERGAEASL